MAFQSIKLKPEQLLLDPNNPRFSKSHKEETREGLFEDSEVQDGTLKKMLENEAVHEIEASILRAGFLDLDPILVRKIEGSGKYLVLEGNRRISAVKSIIQKHNSGTAEANIIPSNILETMKEIICKDLTGEDPAEIDFYLGLRHGGGIKQWPPLPASYNLFKIYMKEYAMKHDCEPVPDNFIFDPAILINVAASFSITTSAAKKRLMTYRVYADLVEKKPYLQQQLEKKYSVIEEMLAKKSVKEEFEFDGHAAFTFSSDGCDMFFDVVFGSEGRDAIIGGASVGTEEGASVRSFAALLSAAQGAHRDEFVDRRMYEKREDPEELLGELRVREKERTLFTALTSAADELRKITQGELIGNADIGEAEIELLDIIKTIIADIDKKISKNKK